MLAHSLANESFNFGGRQPAHGPDTPRLPVQEGRRKVIAILDPSLADMAWGHSVAAVVIDAADQHGFGFGACDRVVVALLIELGLYRVKEFTLEDGGLLAGQDLALEHDLAGPVTNTLGAGTTVSFGRRASEGGTGTGGTVAGDQPDSDIEGEICPEPPENDRELIAPSGQEEDMHRTPQPPCQGTGQLHPAEIGHRALSTDGG